MDLQNHLYLWRDLDSRLRQTANVDLYHVSKFSLTCASLAITSTSKSVAYVSFV